MSGRHLKTGDIRIAAGLISEFPLPLGSGGFPSEQTGEQSSEKANKQTSLREVHNVHYVHYYAVMLVLFYEWLKVNDVSVAKGVFRNQRSEKRKNYNYKKWY